MSDYFLEVSNISKTFAGVQALKNVSLKICPGEIRCLAGENGCGKSTLIKIISGSYIADEGKIVIDGKDFKKISPKESMRLGIQVIFQDFSLFGNLTVAENIAMAYNISNGNRFLNRKRDAELAGKILNEVGVCLDINAEVGRISMAEKQIVAICRALLQNAKLVIMDEPTTSLTKKEVDSLFAIIRKLKEKGVAILFVSHKLDEVFEISEHVTILRNGKNAVEGKTSDFNKNKMTFYMTGKELSDRSFSNEINAGRSILKAENLSGEGVFNNVSFELFEGEVLGITGLLGSGRTELAESIFGILPLRSGTLNLCGAAYKPGSPGDAVRAGIAYVPEDRLTKGLFLDLPIERNIAASILSRFSNKMAFLNKSRIVRMSRQQAKELSIKAASLEDSVSSLSGGNQQRVVLAKWLATDPRLMIFNSPTVGVDVGSKSEIHEIISEFARRGIGVIVISDDLPEVLSLCNRVLVMNGGLVTGEYQISEIDEAFLQAQVTKV